MAKCNPTSPVSVAAKELCVFFEARSGVKSPEHFPAVMEKFPASSECGCLLTKLVNSNDSEFNYHIQHPSSTLPDHFGAITSPLSFITVQKKMESGQYVSVRAFATTAGSAESISRHERDQDRQRERNAARRQRNELEQTIDLERQRLIVSKFLAQAAGSISSIGFDKQDEGA